jgi:hypothetical protein
MSDLNEDWLFDPTLYGDATGVRRKRATNANATVEPLVSPWVLLSNRGGVIGFHVPKHVDRYSTAHALCGVQGHVVPAPSRDMVRCPDCEMRRTSE